MGFMSSSSIGVKALPPILQRWVQDPIGISAIGSLALHLPLLVLLPKLFFTTPGLEEPELKSAVDVVELTAAEQGRIADFQTPEIILPPLSQTPSSLSITPLPKPSTSSFSEPSLPPLPNTPSSSLWGFGSSFQFPPVGNTTPPPFVVQQPQQPYMPYVPPRVTVRPTTPDVVPQQPTTSPSPTASPTASPSPSPSPTSPVAGVEPVDTPTPPPRTEAQVNQELLARNQEIRDSLTFNEAGTGDGDSNSALQKWLEESGQPWLGIDQGAVIGATPKLSMNGSYPAVAGYRNLEGKVIVAVLVNEEGKPASETASTLLTSSGYRIFDRLALQDALSYPFEPTGKKATYFINVVYAPNRDS
jgi:TonB family protein